MRKILLSVVTLSLTFCLSPAPAADPPFSADAFRYPFRSVAAADGMLAARFNPANLSLTNRTEFGWFHQFTSGDRGANNSLMYRSSGAALSISWIDEGGNSSRREILLAVGRRISAKGAFGGSVRQIKSDNPDLDDKRIYTLAMMLLPTRAVWIGARWENVGHEEQADEPTQGLVVGGIRVRPAGPRLTLAADWFYPDGGALRDSEYRFSAHVRVQRGINIRASIDSQEQIRVEFRVLEHRNSSGVEARTMEYSEFYDGTFYISTQDKPYPNSKDGRRRRR